MLILGENGEIYMLQLIERTLIQLSSDRIAAVRHVDRSRIDALNLDVDYIDTSGCVVSPVPIDPWQHFADGSIEDGGSPQTPEIRSGEDVRGGGSP